MPVVLPAQPTSHPFAEAFSYLPTPTLLLDNDGNIVAGSVGLAELSSAATNALALIGRPLLDVQAQLGAVATAWAYAHSVVRLVPWGQPPTLLPVASSAGPGLEPRLWQPSLTRIDLGDQTVTHWLATAHITTLAAPAGATTPPATPKAEEVTQLRDTLAHIPGYVVTLHGPEHRISYAGPTVAALLGQSQLLGRLATNVLADMQASDALQALTYTYQTGQPITQELALPDASNQLRNFRISLQPLRDANQQVSGVLVFGQEVSIPASQAATASTTPSQDTNEHLSQITSISSAEGVVEYLSPQWFRYTGQPPEALSTHDWVDALDPEDWARILHELPEHLRKGEPWSWDAHIRRHDGEYRRHIAHMVPTRDANGRIVRWLGTMTDVQDLPPASDSTSANAPDPCRELTDTLPQLLWTLSPDGTTGTMNKAAASFLPSETQLSAGESVPSLFPGTDVVQALTEQRYSFGPEDTWEYQSQLRRHDGEMRWFLHRAQPLRNAEGQIVKWYGSSTDIEALKQEMAQLLLQNKKLTRSNQELDAFVKSAADELRQPIHNLQALFGQMREAVTFHDPDANALLVMADSSLSRWNATVRNLTQLVKAQEQNQLPPEELSLATLTREALLGLHPHLRASGGEVSTHFQSLPTVSYVRPHLLSIITNLLSSSIKQHDPSRPLRLRLESKPGPAGRAQLVVQDNGLGLEPSRVAGRTSRSPQPTNSAAGLYLINRIVEDHGGSFDVESVPGQGTTFRVTL
jgi:PAS domain S-box-containing protein